MERIMPMDLERTKLERTFRGYDRKQVDDLLAQAAKEMETLRTELQQAQATLERQQTELESHRAQENTLKEALILAQRTADETRAGAHREADLILAEAERKARDSEKAAADQINNLRWDLERLRIEKQKFLNQFRGMLETQLRDLAESGGLAVVDGGEIESAVEKV